MDTESEIVPSGSNVNTPRRLRSLFGKETGHRSTLYRRTKRLKSELLGDVAKMILPGFRVEAGECLVDETSCSVVNVQNDMQTTLPRVYYPYPKTILQPAHSIYSRRNSNS
uniref:Uncharacterized protein n=2 Tax=Trichobilharzia regenti TaxID=157069 RepID=A0AA85J844_TRIRE|nr:unnamed protein product [Trichobilharzia regenti]CAH8872904.1 unnamed protein product [Trichobilharzia regenti]